MVNFGNNVIGKCSDTYNSRYIILVDDINTDNFEKYNRLYNLSNIKINSKFPMPTSNSSYILTSERGKKITELSNILYSIENDVKNNKSKLFTTETQFRNFKAKVIFWVTGIFKTAIDELNNDKDVSIVVRNTVSKHEWEMLKILNRLGANILVISKNIESLDITDINSIETEITRTHEDKEFISTVELSNDIKVDVDLHNYLGSTFIRKFDSTEDIESALYESKDKIQIIVNGMKNYIDTCNFYGRLYKECQDNPSWRLFKNGFDKPTYEETSVIPRLKIDKADYIIDTLIKFVNIKNQSISEIIKNKVKEEFKKSDYHNVNCNQLYNKIVYCVCILNKLFNNTDNLECIIYYGYVRSNDIPVISILNEADLVSLVITCSDKQKSITIPGMSLLELESSTEIFEMPIVDKRDSSSTLAAQAEHRANTTLFDGNTLGFYKHGQFRTARIKHFNTTFDEIKLWWNRELYLRPGFESLGDTAVIPSITKLIKGVKDGEQKYLELIQLFSCGKTILCKSLTEFSSMKSSGSRMHILRCADINGTRFEDQKPFYENSKLNKSRIKSAKNYSYGFMDLHKQDFILDNIELILNYNYIKLNGINKQEYTDLVLNTLLNLDKTLLQYIQWFEYYTYNPNLILIINEETTMSLENMILLTFMSNIGFDVLIFVPTGYTTIENLVGPLFMYDEHIIGEYEYSINTNNISVTSNIEIIDNQKEEKKQGFFGKLFSKGEN